MRDTEKKLESAVLAFAAGVAEAQHHGAALIATARVTKQFPAVAIGSGYSRSTGGTLSALKGSSDIAGYAALQSVKEIYRLAEELSKNVFEIALSGDLFDEAQTFVWLRNLCEELRDLAFALDFDANERLPYFPNELCELFSFRSLWLLALVKRLRKVL